VGGGIDFAVGAAQVVEVFGVPLFHHAAPLHHVDAVMSTIMRLMMTTVRPRLTASSEF
jgi:hypothetical protein